LAGFQVSTYGRIWVSTEGHDVAGMDFLKAMTLK
jgi:hypothetical protein